MLLAKTEMVCSSCGKSKKLRDYYSSNSPIHKFHKKLPVCKQCLWDMVDPNSIRSVMNVLRMCDKPFISYLYDSSIKEASKKDSNPFQIYMKNVVMHQYRDYTWEDSEFDDDYIEENTSYDERIEQEVLDRWRGYDEGKIEILENYYQELISTYEHDTPIQRSIYRNIAVAQMQADEAIANNKTGDYQKLMKVISDLMNDAKIKPLQDNGVDDRGLNTWGEWVRKIEETEPIPEPSEEFKDVDGIRKYIEKWYVKHMKKVFGLESTTEAESDILEDGDA